MVLIRHFNLFSFIRHNSNSFSGNDVYMDQFSGKIRGTGFCYRSGEFLFLHLVCYGVINDLNDLFFAQMFSFVCTRNCRSLDFLFKFSDCLFHVLAPLKNSFYLFLLLNRFSCFIFYSLSFFFSFLLMHDDKGY